MRQRIKKEGMLVLKSSIEEDEILKLLCCYFCKNVFCYLWRWVHVYRWKNLLWNGNEYLWLD